MTTDTFQIPAVNLPRLETEIDKLNRRAKKLGCQPLVLTLGKTIVEKRKNPFLNIEYDFIIKECSIEGESPKLNGWTLVAILEPAPNGEMLVNEVPGHICPVEFRKSDFQCDHCGTHRRRSALFVLRNENGEHKQVGRNCMADFLGHQSPESLLNLAQFLIDVAHVYREAESDSWGYSIASAPIHLFVSVTNCVIRKFGWVSRSNGQNYEFQNQMPTANVAFEITTQNHMPQTQSFIEKHELHPEAQDLEIASKAIEWASSLTPETAKSTYLHDLGVCCRSSIVTSKTAGYVASLINAYHRHTSEEESKKVKVATTTHVGTLGKREIFSSLTIVKLHNIEGGMFPKTLVKFNDSEGNVLIWWASGSPNWLEIGKTVSVKATVEKHSVFNEIPQTELKRVIPVETFDSEA
jgi:hypothetical protein